MNRRLRRMQIVKHKRMLGLINPLNANMVRYKQKQATALLKSRSKGRFIPDDYFPVCYKPMNAKSVGDGLQNLNTHAVFHKGFCICENECISSPHHCHSR